MFLHCVGLCPLCMAIRAQGNLSMNAAWISESSWTTFWATWYIQFLWRLTISQFKPFGNDPDLSSCLELSHLKNIFPADGFPTWAQLHLQVCYLCDEIFSFFVAYVSHDEVSWQPIASDVTIFSRNRTEAHFWKLNNCLVTSFLA